MPILMHSVVYHFLIQAPETIKLMEYFDSTPVTASQIRILTSRDPLLSKVKQFVRCGWPESTEPELKPFAVRKDELSIQDGCLLWGGRVVVPPQVREEVMLELHEAHSAIARMKSLARQYVWWPCMDAHLEKKVKMFSLHARIWHLPPLHPWEWLQWPWSRVHADYAGLFMWQMFLLLVDLIPSGWLLTLSLQQPHNPRSRKLENVGVSGDVGHG